MASASLAELQYQFCAHLRERRAAPPPSDVDPRRLEIYRELLFKNVESFMAKGFPVLRALTPDLRWQAMIRDYFARHRARTALFPRMPEEFLRYLTELRDDPDDPPFLRELAHYEWLEAEVLFDTREVDAVTVDETVDWTHGVAVANPVLRAQAYRYPVHRIGPDRQPAAPPAGETYLVVFRRRDDSVGFMELNAVSARLLELILTRDDTPVRVLLAQVAAELAHPDPAVVMEGGRRILETLREREIVLGTRRPAT